MIWQIWSLPNTCPHVIYKGVTMSLINKIWYIISDSGGNIRTKAYLGLDRSGLVQSKKTGLLSLFGPVLSRDQKRDYHI